MPVTFSPAEAEFEEILRQNKFLTASLKGAVKAPSIEDGSGLFVILPDILAIDRKGQGWCFEVKDEAASRRKMRHLQMTQGYSGLAWFLKYRHAFGYSTFSAAFDCPCVIAIHTKKGWRAEFFTHKTNGRVDFNHNVVVPGWDDPEGIPILFDEMKDLAVFFKTDQDLLKQHWRNDGEARS